MLTFGCFISMSYMKHRLIILFCLFGLNSAFNSEVIASEQTGLAFRYGIMYCGKSTEIYDIIQKEDRDDIFLITAEIVQKDKLNPSMHVRNIGDIPVDYIFNAATDFNSLFSTGLGNKHKIFIDEGQFLTPAQVKAIWAYKSSLLIFIYGLMNDCFANKFPSSESLEKLADKVESVDSRAVCPCCGRRAICTVRIDEKYCVSQSGDQIAPTSMGYRYISVCENHRSGDLTEFATEIDEICAK